MKNIVTILTFIIVFAIWGTQETKAQYRQYGDCDIGDVRDVDEGEYLELYNRRSAYKRSKCSRGDEYARGDEEVPFEFWIYYTDINVLLRMQAAIAAAQRAAVEAWLRKQEDNFRKEINRQLGTDHTSFRDAQKDFFKNYEENVRGVEQHANRIASNHSGKAWALNEEQKIFTAETYYLREWEQWGNWCGPHQSAYCDFLSNTEIRGAQLGNANRSMLYKLKEWTINDFSKREYESAQNLSWSQGLYKIVDDGSLLSGMVDNHIAYYNQMGLEDKIFLMTAYLTVYYYPPGPMAIPISQYRILDFWDDSTLLEMGKEKAPQLSDAEKIFKEGFFENEAERCNYKRTSFLQTVCFGNMNRLQNLKDQVIQEHINGLNFDDGITNELTGKAKCVYEKMVDNNNNINWILENFEDGDKPSEFNLIFEMSNTLKNETNASMATPQQSGIPNTFVIRINRSRAFRNTVLTIARTIIHEGIHARLWEFVYRNEGKVNKDDFSGVYEYRRIYNKNWDHQQMADFYRETIAKGLKQFDNGKRTDEFYDALAWEGLSEIKDKNGDNSIIYTEAWKKEPNKDEILEIIKNHKKNGSKECN